MTYTTNYNLKKPDTTDLVDVGDLNDNADAIDTALAGKEDTLPSGTNDGDVLTWDSGDSGWEARSLATTFTREIRDSGTTANYTAAELAAFGSAGYIITFDGIPILDWAAAGGNFYFSTINTSGSYQVLGYRARNSVNSSKVITLNNPRYIPITINSKTASSSTGDISLVAADISATVGWSPSADTDLATKKYVDDNAGGGAGKEDVSNKVTSLSNASTDTQYPSAKCVYDLIGDVESILADLIGGNS